jgi:uncharacterized SAM-binding protein YcdF (DUF218 family)
LHLDRVVVWREDLDGQIGGTSKKSVGKSASGEPMVRDEGEAGSPHPLRIIGEVQHKAHVAHHAAARLARDLGVPGEQILAETSPRTTREEAARISRRLQSRTIRRILLVTDSEHLARAAIRAFTVSLVHISTAIHNTRIARHDASP